MESNYFMAVILLGILSATFFLRWGFYNQVEEILPRYLFSVLPWRCAKMDWIWTRPFFVVAEFFFLMSVVAGIIGNQTGTHLLFVQGILFLTGVTFRELVRIGLREDNYGKEFIKEVFNPW